jgi:hypothetical protein
LKQFYALLPVKAQDLTGYFDVAPESLNKDGCPSLPETTLGSASMNCFLPNRKSENDFRILILLTK